MREKNGIARCVVCDDVIDTPLCASCIEKEIIEWLGDKHSELTMNIQSIALKDSGDRFPSCIKCGSNINICQYCFIKDMKEIIEVKKPKLVEEFQNFFGIRN